MNLPRKPLNQKDYQRLVHREIERRQRARRTKFSTCRGCVKWYTWDIATRYCDTYPLIVPAVLPLPDAPGRVRVEFSPAEYRKLERLAQREGCSVAEWVRQAAVERLK